jgi:hypothetical protein
MNHHDAEKAGFIIIFIRVYKINFVYLNFSNKIIVGFHLFEISCLQFDFCER